MTRTQRVGNFGQGVLAALIVTAGVVTASLLAKGSPIYAAMPLLMALLALGLSARLAFIAGLVAAGAAIAKTLMTAFALDPLSFSEWLTVAAFLLGWGALLAVIASSRRGAKFIAALLIVLATPVFIATAVPLVRSLDTVQLSSVYIPMRDNVKIAADVYLPRGADNKSLPTILRQTRYFRRTVMHWPYSLLFGGMREEIRRFVNSDYAFVVVDARGSGASFGSRQQEWSDDEIKDGAQVVDWIIEQPWSSGKVGSTGVSYDGTTSEMLLVNQHPAVKAIAPRFSLLDGYDDIAFPGGVHLSWFTENWGGYNDALDRNALSEKLEGFAKRTVKGIAPVDGQEDLLADAVADHKKNYDISGFTKGIIYRDDEVPSTSAGDNRSSSIFTPAAATSGLTLARMSPFAKPAIAQSGTPVFSYSGWYDGAYQRAAVSRYLSYKIPGSRLLIGGWDHGARQNISPHNPAGTPAYDQTGELLRFFDFYLKGKANGWDTQKPVRYYTMGEEAWKESDTWPPAAQTRTLYFAADKKLLETAPARDTTPDKYTVDLTASSGTGTRWRSYFNTTGARIGYPDRAEADEKLLLYNSAPLTEDMEITGHPALTLWVASTATDGQFFAYLEDVAPDGKVTYITEGLLRALHRKVSKTAPYWQPAPMHSFLRADGQPLVPGESAEISFALLPTSYRVRKGHSIRVALAGADVDQFAPLPGDAPTWNVYRDAAHASRIALPVIPRGAAP